MTEQEIAYKILNEAFAEWTKRQTLIKGSKSTEEFANYLGYSQQAVNFWLNRKNKISERAIDTIAPKLAELLGTEIYKILGLPMPDKSKIELDNIWENLSNEKKSEILKLAKKFTKNDR